VITEILSRGTSANQSFLGKMFKSRQEKTCIELFREDLGGSFGDTDRFKTMDIFEVLIVETGGLESDTSEHLVWGVAEVEGRWSGGWIRQ
jgi:hypothetical protein